MSLGYPPIIENAAARIRKLHFNSQFEKDYSFLEKLVGNLKNGM